MNLMVVLLLEVASKNTFAAHSLHIDFLHLVHYLFPMLNYLMIINKMILIIIISCIVKIVWMRLLTGFRNDSVLQFNKNFEST